MCHFFYCRRPPFLLSAATFLTVQNSLYRKATFLTVETGSKLEFYGRPLFLLSKTIHRMRKTTFLTVGIWSTQQPPNSMTLPIVSSWAARWKVTFFTVETMMCLAAKSHFFYCQRAEFGLELHRISIFRWLYHEIAPYRRVKYYEPKDLLPRHVRNQRFYDAVDALHLTSWKDFHQIVIHLGSRLCI